MRMTKTRFTLALLVVFVLVAAFAALPANAGSSKCVVHKYIEADTGGVIHAGGVTVVFPPGALPRNAMIMMKVDLNTQELQFAPDMKFNKPVFAHFAFSVKQLYYWDRGKWVPVPTSNNSSVLSHFSRYAWW